MTPGIKQPRLPRQHAHSAGLATGAHPEGERMAFKWSSSSALQPPRTAMRLRQAPTVIGAACPAAVKAFFDCVVTGCDPSLEALAVQAMLSLPFGVH